MTSWTVISRQDHATSRWRARQGFNFAAELTVVDVLLEELAHLLPHYAIGFVRSQSGVFRAVALTGLTNRNLYVNAKGQWLGKYVPASLRSYPFALAETAKGEKVLCMEKSHLSDDASDHPLLEADGELAPLASKVLMFLMQCQKSKEKTRVACDTLADADLLEEWHIPMNIDGREEPIMLQGLYRINEKAFHELNAKKLIALRNASALQLVYGQLFSTVQLYQLSERAQHIASEQPQATVDAHPDELFGDAGSLNFDNLG